MHLKTIGKWVLRGVATIFVLLLLAIAGLFYMTYQTIDQTLGGQTKVVENAEFTPQTPTTAITNVNVLSADGTTMLKDRTVLIGDKKILSISQHNKDLPKDVLKIDGQGKYLIPGLVDSHIHIQRSPNDLLLYVANGVTQVRSMNSSSLDVKLKKQIKNGRLGPHLYVSTPSMNSIDGFGDMGQGMFPSWIPEFVIVWAIESLFNIHVSTGSVQAAENAKSYILNGRDGIKLYGFLTMDSYRAILDAAEKLDIPTAGHLPNAMPLSELKTTKLREIAHIEEIEKALRREYHSLENKDKESFLSLVQRRKDEIIADLRANDIAVHSTLWFNEGLKDQVFDLPAKLKSIQLEYANPGIVEGTSSSLSEMMPVGWLPGRNKFERYAGTTPEEIAGSEAYWNEYIEAHHILFRAMVDEGVTILAGTDANGWMAVPGFSLHDELKTLAQRGMSPAQALYAATAAPAHLIKNNAGIIEAGRRADLVLLNHNPLIDIKNTTSIETVIINGEVLDRKRLDALLDEVRIANEASRKIDISEFL